MLADAADQKKASDFGLQNVEIIAKAADAVGLPFHAACALMEMESMGRSIYGSDFGGALSGYPNPVTEENFRVFEWLVFKKGSSSNGVGPCQITWKGFFPDMAKKKLKVWVPYDNMFYGMTLLWGYRKETGTWAKAGTKYNGKASYGRTMSRKVSEWKARLA